MKKNISGTIRPEEYFILNTGLAIKNIEELNSALKKMNDETFNHHVNSEKNDFYNWIKNVLKDKKLASQLKKAKDKKEMISAISKKIQEIKKSEKLKNIQKIEKAKVIHQINFPKKSMIMKIKEAVQNA